MLRSEATAAAEHAVPPNACMRAYDVDFVRSAAAASRAAACLACLAANRGASASLSPSARPRLLVEDPLDGGGLRSDILACSA